MAIIADINSKQEYKVHVSHFRCWDKVEENDLRL